MTVKSTQSLGPFSRYGIWVQGCQKRCAGCISSDSQALDGGYEVNVLELVNDILSTPNIEGITISGGEPFLQSMALFELVTLIRAKRDLGVITYTGMTYDEIKENELAQACDMIIDGEYREELNDGLSLRGSSNQNICLITQRYATAIGMYGARGRKVELHFKGDKVTLVGIPDKNSLKMLKDENLQKF